MQPRPPAEISSFECPTRSLRIAAPQCAYVKIKRQSCSITSARLTAGFVNRGPFNQLKHGTLPGPGGRTDMTTQTRLLGALFVAGLAVSLPVAAEAQLQPPVTQAPAKAAQARAAAPAARPAPAPHVAPVPRAAAPAAPRFAPAARIATPHTAPPARVATPRFTPQQHAAPQVRSAPAINRSVQRQQFQQERALRRGRTSSRPFRPDPSSRHSQTPLSQQQVQVNTRQQLRAERTLRRTEDRALAPPARIATRDRREQIEQARQQRTLVTATAGTAGRPARAANSNAPMTLRNRRNGGAA